MSGLPDGWVDTTLGNIVSLSKEKADPQNTDLETYVGLEHISSNKREIATFGEASEVKSTKNHFHENEILYGKLRPYLNKVWKSDREGICSTDILVLIPQQDISTSFIERRIFSPDFVDYAMERSNGINLPRTKYTEIQSFPINLPPSNEQKRIVTKLESCEARIDAAWEALNDVPKLLEHYRQSVLAAAFRGDLTSNWRTQNPDTEPAEQLLQRLRAERRQRWEQAELEKFEAKGKAPPKNWKDKYPDTSIKKIENVDAFPEQPEGWQYVSLESLCDANRPICYGVIKLGNETTNGIPCLRTSNVRHLHLETETIKRISPQIENEYTRTRLQGNEVLVNVRGTLGGVAVVPYSMVGWNISREVAMGAILPQMDSEYVSLMIAGPYAQAWLTGVLKGVAYTGINISDLKQLLIPVAPIDEQRAIVKKVNSALHAMKELSAHETAATSDLTSLTQSLLAKAFRGELIPQDPNDEPACELLERIAKARQENAKTKVATKTNKRNPA